MAERAVGYAETIVCTCVGLEKAKVLDVLGEKEQVR